MTDKTIDEAINTVGHRDTGKVSANLGSWLASRWSGAKLVQLSTPSGSGASSELFFVDIDGLPDASGTTRAVLRLASDWPVYPMVDMETQARCMTIARRAGLPVPRVLAVEKEGLLDVPSPFLLMERLTGSPAPDSPSYVIEGWMHDLPASKQELIWHNGIKTIAALHSANFSSEEGVQCRLPVSGDTGMQRMLNYWTLFLDHAGSCGATDTLSESVAWLHANAPEGCADEGLVWGDASLRNMLFKDTDICALLDFEFSHCGVLAFDVAFYALMDHIMATGFADGAKRLAGFPGIGQTLDYYEDCTGRNVNHREYWLRTALTYSALSTTRVYQRLSSHGRIKPEDVASNPPLEMLRNVLAGGTLPD